MPKYKMLCLDLDGTLFTSRRTISRRTKDSIAEAERAGVAAVITTGRPLFDAEIRGRILHETGHVIASNGAAVGNVENGTAIRTIPFGENELSLLKEMVEGNRLSATWFSSQAIYTQGARVSRLYRAIGRAEKKVLAGRILPASSLEKKDIQKCNLFFLDIDSERCVFEEIGDDGRFELVFTGRHCAEITMKGVSKASGIEILAGMHNISRDEIIAIGDSENDLAMIRYAGLGVAMGNAIPALKNEADFITASNDHDGIADVIERFILSD